MSAETRVLRVCRPRTVPPLGRIARLTKGIQMPFRNRVPGGSILLSVFLLVFSPVPASCRCSLGPGQTERPGPPTTLIRMLAGAGGALVIGASSSFLGSQLAHGTGGQFGDNASVVGGFVGAFAGVGLGSAAGVHLAGKSLGTPTSFRASLLGSVGGLGAFFLLISPASLDPDEVPFWVALVGLPSIGAVLFQRGTLSKAGADTSSSPSLRIGARLVPRADGSVAIMGSVKF